MYPFQKYQLPTRKPENSPAVFLAAFRTIIRIYTENICMYIFIGYKLNSLEPTNLINANFALKSKLDRSVYLKSKCRYKTYTQLFCKLIPNRKQCQHDKDNSHSQDCSPPSSNIGHIIQAWFLRCPLYIYFNKLGL